MKSIIPYLVDAVQFTRGGVQRTFRYWMETETHVYSFAMAANVLLSFVPFMLVMMSLCRSVLHWPAAADAIGLAIRDFFGKEMGSWLWQWFNYGYYTYHSNFEWRSVLLLMFTANGVFMPLEVALNRAWGVTSNRSFVKNQIVSTVLIFACGALVLLSCIVSAANAELFNMVLGRWPSVAGSFIVGTMKLTSLPFSIGALLLIYWLLPNRKINPRYLVPSAIRVGLTLEAAKWVSIWITPWMLDKFKRETILFQHSITILTWSFLAAMVVLAGAQSSVWRARAMEERELAEARVTAIDTTHSSTDQPTG